MRMTRRSTTVRVILEDGGSMYHVIYSMFPNSTNKLWGICPPSKNKSLKFYSEMQNYYIVNVWLLNSVHFAATQTPVLIWASHLCMPWLAMYSILVAMAKEAPVFLVQILPLSLWHSSPPNHSSFIHVLNHSIYPFDRLHCHHPIL